MGQEMILTDANNNEIKCHIVARWKENGNSYIAYTDGSMVNGQNELFVSKCIEDNGQMRICDITDDKEWAYVNDYLDRFANSEEDYE